MIDLTEVWKKAEVAIEKLIKEYALKVEFLTEKQLAEAIRQAIECGDFQRHIMVDPMQNIYSDGGTRIMVRYEPQSVVYIPYRQCEELKQRVKDLENQLRKAERFCDNISD